MYIKVFNNGFNLCIFARTLSSAFMNKNQNKINMNWSNRMQLKYHICT